MDVGLLDRTPAVKDFDSALFGSLCFRSWLPGNAELRRQDCVTTAARG
jgi:hypothetical protein